MFSFVLGTELDFESHWRRRRRTEKRCNTIVEYPFSVESCALFLACSSRDRRSVETIYEQYDHPEKNDILVISRI